MRKKFYIKRFSLATLILICILSCFGFVASMLILTHILALLSYLISPDSVSIGQGMTPVRYIVSMFALLIGWPILAGLFLGISGWIVFSIIGRFTSFQLDVVIDDEESGTNKA